MTNFKSPSPKPKPDSSGLDPGISLRRTHLTPVKHVDGRIKCGHDVFGVP